MIKELVLEEGNIYKEFMETNKKYAAKIFDVPSEEVKFACLSFHFVHEEKGVKMEYKLAGEGYDEEDFE